MNPAVSRLLAAACVLATPWVAHAAPFGPVEVLFPQIRIHDIAIGDVTGDGRDDLLILVDVEGDGPQVLRVMTQRPDGTLDGPVDVVIGPRLQGPTMGLADMDGDGLDDVVIGSLSRGLSILRNAGGLAFVSVQHPYDGWLRDLAFDDVDGDGALDVIGLTATQFMLARGDGAGGLAGITHFGTGGTGMQLVDLDGDGRLDIASHQFSRIDLLRATGGGFEVARTLANPFGIRGSAPVFADFDGDGLADYAVGRDDGPDASAIAMFRQRPDGTFRFHQSRKTSGYPDYLLAPDLDGDARPDLTAIHGGPASTVSSFINVGGVFGQAMRTPGMSTSTARVRATGDLDGDGRVDLAGAAPASGVRLMSGTSTPRAIPDAVAGISLTATSATATITNAADVPGQSGFVFTIDLHARTGPLDILALPDDACNRSAGANGGVRLICWLPTFAAGESRSFTVEFIDLDRSRANIVYASATAAGGGDDSPHNNVAHARLTVLPPRTR